MGKKQEKAAKRKEEKKVQKKVAKAKGEKAKKKVVKDEKKKVEKATAAKKKKKDKQEAKKEVAKEEKKVDKAIKPKKKGGKAALIDIPDEEDGILSLLQASQGVFLDSDNICVTAKKGDMAPINGQFDGLEVAGGTVAMVSGTFCVDQSTLALVQRSWGLSSAEEVEEVVKKKSTSDKKKAKDAKVKA